MSTAPASPMSSNMIQEPGTTARQPSLEAFDAEQVRQDFPILKQRINGRPLAYLDNAATTQKPQIVIDTIRSYYEMDNANVHRGVHELSRRATEHYERVRGVVQRFIGAADESEIIFTRGTTEAINLVAGTFGRQKIQAGDEVLVSAMEHHSNIVPWQMLCLEKGAALKVIPMNDQGELLLDDLDALLTPRTKLLAIVHVSNALGTVNPIREMIRRAHARNVPVLVDGAQGVAHMPVDVRDLDCDFYAFSGHKVFGPTGIGVLYGKAARLRAMPPYQGGGDMISSVSFQGTTYRDIPHKFEAGTPHIEGVIGLGAALDYLTGVGLERAAAYENELLAYTAAALSAIPQVRLIGTARHKASVVSFVVAGAHPHDVGEFVNKEGVAIRVGHHCAQPVMDRFCIPATARASIAFYNTKSDIDALVGGIHKVIKVFG